MSRSIVIKYTRENGIRKLASLDCTLSTNGQKCLVMMCTCSLLRLRGCLSLFRHFSHFLLSLHFWIPFSPCVLHFIIHWTIQASALVDPIIDASPTNAFATSCVKPPKVICSHRMARVFAFIEWHTCWHVRDGAINSDDVPRTVDEDFSIGNCVSSVGGITTGFWLEPWLVNVNGESECGPTCLEVHFFCKNIEEVWHCVFEVTNLTLCQYMVCIIWFWTKFDTWATFGVEVI